MTRVRVYLIGVSLTCLFAACDSDVGDNSTLEGGNATGGSVVSGAGGAVSTGGFAVSGTGANSGGITGGNSGGTGGVVTQTSGGTGGAALAGTGSAPGTIDAGLDGAATNDEDGSGEAEGGNPDGSTGETKDAGRGATISIDDPVLGFASVAGGTTGGGTNLAAAIVVGSMTELRGATSGSSQAIVLVQPGNNYAGELSPGANKTIVGIGPGVKITGNLKISGSDRNNIIVRNIAVQGEKCSSYDTCKQGADAVYVGNGAHHVWLDHLDVSDGQDGNCDITQGGDYVTVSWTHFHYTYNKEHRFSNLIAGSDDEPASVGKLHITYMNCHWGDRVDQRQPRGRFGNIHMLNNYHNTGGSQIHGVGKDMALIAENSVYDEGISIWKDMGSPRGWKGTGNIGTGRDLNSSYGTVFDIPYNYTAMPALEVVAAVTSSECGAGNSCEFAQ